MAVRRRPPANLAPDHSFEGEARRDLRSGRLGLTAYSFEGLLESEVAAIGK
jgi:hypothetical protein